MRIVYQGFPGAYGHKASKAVAAKMGLSDSDIEGVRTFSAVFDRIDAGDVGVLPFENSYAGSIHENFYRMLSGGYRVFHEHFQEVDHFLLSAGTDLSTVKRAYSHPQALMQCAEYLKARGIEPEPFGDTAGAAQYVKTLADPTVAAIASDLAWELYGLNALDARIQDQSGNTTRFFVVAKNPTPGAAERLAVLPKSWKTSLVFATRDVPSALYKCLGAFATRFVNLTKIESLPSKENRFEYVFWIDVENTSEDAAMRDAVEELAFFSTKVLTLGEY